MHALALGVRALLSAKPAGRIKRRGACIRPGVRLGFGNFGRAAYASFETMTELHPYRHGRYRPEAAGNAKK